MRGLVEETRRTDAERRLRQNVAIPGRERKKPRRPGPRGFCVVGDTGLEPMTSSV
jgi:hypothetical protein